jgi:hypothetical protein
MSEISKAKRPFFAAKSADKEGCIYYEKIVEFDWYKGLSWQVRQKSSLSFAAVIEKMYPTMKDKILEVSTKSINYELGTALSAMNLNYYDESTSQTFTVENWFQSSKQFIKNGNIYGPYKELLHVDPLTAKRYLNTNLDKKIIDQYKDDILFSKIQNEIQNANLHSFVFLGNSYRIEPKSAFYDYLYVKALVQNDSLSSAIKKYRIFTDIEYNPIVKGRRIRFNSQARACAIYVALSNRGLIEEALLSFESFVSCIQYEEM